MTYIVLLLSARSLAFEVRGPYRSFKRAEGDAKAWNGIDGKSASVEPIMPPERFWETNCDKDKGNNDGRG
jgi:hypothetical protein